jgi:glyoxylate reductase
MRPRVHVSRRVPAEVRAELERLFELTIHDSEEPPVRRELLASVAGCDGLVTMLTDRVDEELFDAAGVRLRVVANYAVGVDNVDLQAARRRGIVVANTPDVLTEATAELTVALILALLRRVAEGDRFLRRRRPWSWAPTFMLGRGLANLTLGCVGFGRIGRRVAAKAGALGMRVVYTNRSGSVSGEADRLSLDELLARADVVSLHCPLTPDTQHLIDERALHRMQASAVLVNTARGPVVDEQALAAALAAGQIAGAALDVYEAEPEVAPELLQLENVVLVPHLGSATHEARTAMGTLCVDALRAVLLEGGLPANALPPAELPA